MTIIEVSKQAVQTLSEQAGMDPVEAEELLHKVLDLFHFENQPQVEKPVKPVNPGNVPYVEFLAWCPDEKGEEHPTQVHMVIHWPESMQMGDTPPIAIRFKDPLDLAGFIEELTDHRREIWPSAQPVNVPKPTTQEKSAVASVGIPEPALAYFTEQVHLEPEVAEELLFLVLSMCLIDPNPVQPTGVSYRNEGGAVKPGYNYIEPQVSFARHAESRNEAPSMLLMRIVWPTVLDLPPTTMRYKSPRTIGHFIEELTYYRRVVWPDAAPVRVEKPKRKRR